MSACVATGISKGWINEEKQNQQLKLIPGQTSPSYTSKLPGGAQCQGPVPTIRARGEVPQRVKRVYRFLDCDKSKERSCP